MVRHQTGLMSTTLALGVLIAVGFSIGCAEGDRVGPAPTVSPTPENLLSAAVHLRQQAYYDSALVNLQSALKAFRARGDSLKVVECMLEMGRIMSVRGQHADAMDALHSSATMLSNVQQSSLRLKESLDVDVARTLVRMGRPSVALAQLSEYSPRSGRGVHAVRGFAFYELDDFAAAIEVLETGLRISPSSEIDDVILRSRMSTNLALAWFGLERNYRRARHYLNETERLRSLVLRDDHPQLAEVSGNLGMILMHAGLLREARRYLDRAASIFELGGSDFRINLAVSYSNLGTLNARLGEHELALAFLRRSLEIRQDLLGPNHHRLYYTYTRLARVHLSMMKPAESVHYSRKALSTIDSTNESHSGRRAMIYADIGSAFSAQGLMDSTAHYFELALTLLNSTNLPSQFADVNRRFAAARARSGDLRGAQTRLESARSTVDQAPQPNEILKINILNDLGELHFEKGNLRLAKEYADLALLSNVSQSAMILLGRESLSPLSNREYLRTIELRINANAAACGDPNRIDVCSTHALSTDLKLMARFLRLTRISVNALGPSRTPLVLRDGRLSDTVERVWSHLGCDSACSVANSLFSLVEQSKATLLLDRIDRHWNHPSSWKLDSLTNHMSMLAMLAAEGSSSEAGQGHLQRLADLRIEYDRLLRRVEQTHPTYYALVYGEDVLDANAIVQQISDDEALIEYYYGEDSVYTFTITSSAWRYSSSSRQAIDDAADRLSKSINKSDYFTYVNAAVELYRLLLGHSEDLIATKELIVVPDGPLLQVPFEALLYQEPQDPTSSGQINFSTLPYVIKRHAVSYSYSATLRSILGRRRETRAGGRFLGIAPIEFEASGGTLESALQIDLSGVQSLPGSETEIQRLYSLFEPAYNPIGRLVNNSSTLAIRGDASEELLRSLDLSRYRYIHFATHGIVNDSIPELSGLLMHPSAASDDGILQLGEIYALDLDADLVVLSACDSGRGTRRPGDGVVGLTGAFLYAGARNVLVPLWQIEDVAVADLMVPFYAEFLQRRSYREALRTSKLNLLKAGGRKARPFYWAPFILFDS